jgi:Kelch motif
MCTWGAGPDLPSAGTRYVGVFFPANGKFYAMGGRDASNVEFMHPFEYDPVTNMWTTKSATYPDGFTNNMGCGVLTESGIPYIYCVGGSNFTSQTTTSRVFRYNPVTDVIGSVPAPWPPGDQNIIPGGFSVFNNKFYTLGGFNVNVSGYDGIWEFTPSPAGWVQKNAHLAAPLTYIPTATIGSLIYMGGGADATGGVLTDTTDSSVYNPVTDSIAPIASIPRATSNTRGLNFCNQLWVVGGAFPTPSNEVDIYDPASNTWSVGTPMLDARRNSAMDTNGNNHIWFAGGYDTGGAIVAGMGIFNCPVSPCGASPTPTATATATATAGVSATPTATRTPTATPTATATATSTSSPSATATPTPAVRPTPTARPRPTPRQRP